MNPIIIIGIILVILYIIWKIVAELQVSVSVDKSSYLKGETISISGHVQDSLGNPKQGLTSNLIVTPPEGDIYTLPGVTTDSSGDFTSTWDIPTDAVDGTYTLTASVLGVTADATFTHKRMKRGMSPIMELRVNP